MKNKLQKILSCLPQVVTDIWRMIFASAAENHIRFSQSNKQKYRSYTQLKRQQKKLRRFFGFVFFALSFLLLGLLVGPAFYPKAIEPEVYIPSGKADILIANISRNQATIIFKTLDNANENKPLATKAKVEVYSDKDYANLVRRTYENDYAVTHIMPIDSLQENMTYFVKIEATDAWQPAHSKVVSSWGNGNEQISFFTTGDLISRCDSNLTANLAANKNYDSKNQAPVVETQLTADNESQQLNTDAALQIADVQNENYLQPRNKVQTIITWATNAPANTELLYHEENSTEKTDLKIAEKLQTKHQAVLTSLKAGSTYYFQVKSTDANGTAALSEEYSLKTPRPAENILQKIGDNFVGLIQQIKPR